MRWRSEISGAATCLGGLIAGLLVLVSFDFGLPGQSLLQSLRFHIAGGMLVAVLVLLASRAWWRSTGLLLVMLASLVEGGLIVLGYQQARGAAAERAQPLFSLMSFNVLSENPRPRELADFVADAGADVVLVMEGRPLFGHLEQLRRSYPHIAGCVSGETCGLLILSKTPLEDVEQGDMGWIWRKRLLSARTQIDGQSVTLVAAHMVKPYFDDAAEGEAYVLRQRLSRIEGPLVLAGDFNSAPWSNNLKRLIERGNLLTAPAYPATWPVRLGPAGVPIDNVFTRSGLVIESLRALDDAMGSNHRGLWAEISLAQ